MNLVCFHVLTSFRPSYPSRTCQAVPEVIPIGGVKTPNTNALGLGFWFWRNGALVPKPCHAFGCAIFLKNFNTFNLLVSLILIFINDNLIIAVLAL